MNRKHALLTGALMAATATRGLAQAAGGLTPVRIASTANDDITAALYAIQQDAFRKAGLDVTLNAMNSGAAISAAVAGGAVDIGRSSMLPLITARGKGISFMLIAPAGLYLTSAPDSAVVVAAKSPLRNVKDLEGKIVSSPALGDLDYLGFRNWVDVNGADSKLVQFIELPGSAVVAGVTSGRIAAGALQSPFLGQGIRAGSVRIFGYHLSSMSPRLMQSAWFTTGDYLAKNALVVRAFAQVMQSASAFCNAHPAQTVDLLASFTKMEPATIAASVRTQFATSLNPVLIQPMIDVAAKYKAIDARFEARDFIARVG